MNNRIKRLVIIGWIWLFIYVLVLVWLLTSPDNTDQTNDDIDQTAIDESSRAADYVPLFSGNDVVAWLSWLSIPSWTWIATSPIFSGPVTVAFPERYDSVSLQSVLSGFHSIYSGGIQMTVTWNYDWYMHYLQEWFADGSIDVALVPSDALVNLSPFVWSMQFADEVSSLFVWAVRSMLQQEWFAWQQYTFVPFFLDPLIYITQPVSPLPRRITYERLYSQRKEETGTSSTDIPSLVWIDRVGVTLLGESIQLYDGQFQTLYQLIRQWYTSRDARSFKNFIDTQQLDILQRSTTRLKQLIHQQQAKYQDCDSYPAACLLATQQTSNGMVFASTLVQREKYFGNASLQPDDMQVLPFVQYTSRQPLRVRWLVVNKKSSRFVSSLQFVNYLMQQSIDTTNSIAWWYRLSAFLDTYRLQTVQSRRSYINSYKLQREPLIGSLLLAENFFAFTKITDVLLGKYNVELFFAETEREF